jgi:hypothetical protein
MCMHRIEPRTSKQSQVLTPVHYQLNYMGNNTIKLIVIVIVV